MSENKFWQIVIGVIIVLIFIGAVVATLIGVPFSQNQALVQPVPFEAYPTFTEPTLEEEPLVENSDVEVDTSSSVESL